MWIFVPGLYTRLWQNTINMSLAVYEYIVGPHQHSGHRFIRGGEGGSFMCLLVNKSRNQHIAQFLQNFRNLSLTLLLVFHERHRNNKMTGRYSFLYCCVFRGKCSRDAIFAIRVMMTSSNGNFFRVTGHLCGEFSSHRWIPSTKAIDADLWCFLLWSAPE